MKKMLKSALWGIMIPLGFMGLTACSESEETVVNNTEEKMDVPVQFVFNLSSGMANQTRMSADMTQANGFSGGFRGIADARILAYHLTDGSGNSKNGTHLTGWEQATRLFDLANIVGPGEITAEHSTRVLELSLPNGTNALAFYGRAPRTTAHATEGYVRGYVLEDNRGGKTRFSLVPRVKQYEVDAEGNDTEVETEAYQKWTQMRKLLTTVLNRIASNGLHQESTSGVNGARDMRARIWWPKNNVANYSPQGPLYNDGSKTVALTADNSNIAEVGDGTKSVAITLKDGTSVGAFTVSGTSRTLKTNVDTYDFNLASVEWSTLGSKVATGAASVSPLEEILGRAYNNFTVMKTENGVITEIRAGSSDAICHMVQDLWTVTNQVQTSSPTQYQEAVAQALAQRIYDRFYAYFTADVDASTGVVENCKLRSPKDIVEVFRQYIDSDIENTYTVIKDDSGTEHINLFPSCPDIQMPHGSTQLSCTNGVFSFNETMAAYGLGMTDVSPLKYTWPAELIYFGNSPVRTSDMTMMPSDFPQTVEAWNNEPNWTAANGWSNANNYVTPTTRSVAMKNNIHYGTALLSTSIYYADGALEDNNSVLHPGETNNVINVADGQYSLNVDGEDKNRFNGQKFELTGIVIGGQARDVDWNFIQKADETGNTFSYMIYDGDVPKGEGSNVGTWGAYIPSYTAEMKGSQPNYTLLWDNFDEAVKGQSQNRVYVALEFRNCSGRDFWGTDNLVRDGGTFYLIGMLDPDKAKVNGVMTDLGNDLSAGVEWPTDDNWALPPYDANGNTIKERRVFIQGYKTVVRFGLGKQSLQKAYLTVPDMRSANISLGLSIDLEWKKGLEYDVVIGN